MSVTNVGIKLTLDGAQQAESGLRRVKDGMEGLGRTAQSVRGAMTQLAGVFAGVVSVQAFLQAADAVTTLQNQLKLATGSTQAATQAYGQLFEIAQRSRVSFTELGGTFATITRATESLGLSQQQLLRVTEAIGNAITVSGSSAASSQAALVQLSQGLASGTLRGEELNSVLEQTPRLARALADGLGVSIGQLRELGKEGKLTAEAVIAALQSQAGILAREVQDSVVTVGQAFTQVKNSATALVGEIDRVSGSSTTLAGALQAASTSLDNISRALKDASTQGQQVNVFADAIAVVFETVSVLGVNVAYVIKQIGTEIDGLAAQAAAVARLDFSGAREIGRLMREDAARARTEVDALSDRILNARRLAEQTRKSLEGVDTRAEDARLARFAQAGSRALSTLTNDTKAAEKAAKDFAKSVGDGLKLYGDLTAQSTGLSGNFAEQWQTLADAYKAGKINLEQLTVAQALLIEQQPFAKELAKEQAEALKQQAKAAEDLAKAEFERIEALERSAESAEGQLQRLLDEEKALAIAAEKNITLAQALEEVAIARLRERQAALMAEGDRDAEVLAIQKEIDARKQLAEAIGRKENREAAEQSAKDAAREWERAAENIERSLIDALLRGFESGKDFARNLRDTVINMFQSLVIRPVIQAVVAPIAGGLTGALGLPSNAMAASGAGGSLGLASGLKSVYDTIMGGFTGLGNSVAFAAQDIGAWLVQNTTGVLNQFGGTLMSNAGALGTAGSYLGGIGAGIGLGNMISGKYAAFGNANVSNVAGTAIGAILGGPIGAAIGGAIGGLVNRAFGRGPKEVQSSGLTGTFSTDGASVMNFSNWRRKGGWFRSDKSGTDYSPVSSDFDKFLDTSLKMITAATRGYAEVLGLNANKINGITQSINLNLQGLSQADQEKAIAGSLDGFGERLAQQLLREFVTVERQVSRGGFIGRIINGLFRRSNTVTETVWRPGEFVREGETASQALARLANSLATVNSVFDTLNVTLLQSSLRGADVASKLLDVFGGAEAFVQGTTAYFNAFYTDGERNAIAARQLAEALGRVGVQVPSTREAYRRLVEAQDLTTDSGRRTYASLIQLAGAFDAVQTGSQALQNTLDQLAREVASVFDSLLGRIASGRDGVAADAARIRGPQILSPDQIRAAVQYAAVVGPSTSTLTAAAAAVVARQQQVGFLGGALQGAQANAQRQAAALQARQAELAAAQNSLASLAAPQNQFIRGRRSIERPGYQQELAAFNAQSAELQARIANLSGAVSLQQAAYNDAAASVASYTQQLQAANQALRAAQDAQRVAQEQYAQGVRQFIVDAGRSVDRLTALRQNVIDYYESQRALAENMLGSAGRLREAAAAVRLTQTSPQQAAGQLVGQFQRDYSMALATTGATRAQYADRLATALPQLSEALRATSRTQEEWITSTARLVGQSNAVAQLLEATAPADYEAESLALLGDIDAALVNLEDAAASAEKIISDAIYETGAQNINGLRAIVATLRGETAPRFAMGGTHSGGIRLVGENGPELEITGPSRILNATDTSRLLSGGGGGGAELVAELRALRADNQAQARAIVQLQQRMTKVIERWDGNGLPEERVVA